MLNLGFGEWVAVLSAGIAAASLLANYLTVRRQMHLQREEIRAAVDAGKLTWFERCMTTQSSLTALVRGHAEVYGEIEFERRRVEAVEEISSLADQGRLYFPNLETRKGGDKQAAYRGERPAALAALLFAYDVAANLHRAPRDQGDAIADMLFESRRIFVSEVQRSIDPRRRDAMLGASNARAALAANAKPYGDVVAIVKRLHAATPVKRSAFRA